MMAFRFSLGFDHHPLLPLSRIMLTLIITLTLMSDLTTSVRAANRRGAGNLLPAVTRLSGSLCALRFIIALLTQTIDLQES
jgi:hypothetical protein